MNIDNHRTVDRIEAAIRTQPLCACGAPTDIVSRREGLWLVCTRETGGSGILRRLFGADVSFGHTRKLALDCRDGVLDALQCS
jgi:hypothetical protein